MHRITHPFSPYPLIYLSHSRALAWTVGLLEHMASVPLSAQAAPPTAIAAANNIAEPALNGKDVRALARARPTALHACVTERALVAVVGTANGCVLRVEVSREQRYFHPPIPYS